jgi:ABC-type antimicrobial peptide transport system permease subunit
MIFISFLLSVLAGYIPSRMAAQQDPVKALRTE